MYIYIYIYIYIKSYIICDLFRRRNSRKMCPVKHPSVLVARNCLAKTASSGTRLLILKLR